jgi:hypothetical protein
MSKFDELDFECSKDEVVQLNRKDNPEEAQKWALQQLAAQNGAGGDQETRNGRAAAANGGAETTAAVRRAAYAAASH